ncbi:MAG: hypothetical protein ABJD24_03695 [Acidimicrobiales bacterium]
MDADVAAAAAVEAVVAAVVDGFALLAATVEPAVATVAVVRVAAGVVAGPALVEIGSEAAATVVSGAVLETVVVSVLPQALSPIRSPPVSRRLMRVRVMPPESTPSVNAVRARYEQTVRRIQLACASGTRLS